MSNHSPTASGPAYSFGSLPLHGSRPPSRAHPSEPHSNRSLKSRPTTANRAYIADETGTAGSGNSKPSSRLPSRSGAKTRFSNETAASLLNGTTSYSHSPRRLSSKSNTAPVSKTSSGPVTKSSRKLSESSRAISPQQEAQVSREANESTSPQKQCSRLQRNKRRGLLRSIAPISEGAAYFVPSYMIYSTT